jgi:hypothetical protein
MSDEPLDPSEALDEDDVEGDDDADYSGDAVGDDLLDYPPDRYQGVNTVGVTAVEEDSGESFAERTWREEPEGYRPPQHSDVGQLVDPDDDLAEWDDDEELVAEEEPGEGLSPEESAMHLEPDE